MIVYIFQCWCTHDLESEYIHLETNPMVLSLTSYDRTITYLSRSIIFQNVSDFLLKTFLGITISLSLLAVSCILENIEVMLRQGGEV